MNKTSGIIGLCALLLSPAAALCADRITGKPFATRSEVIATHTMAATSHPLATQVALDIMKSGGNAVDAAIATNAVLGLMEPVSNGIGGDLFAIIWDAKTKQLYGLNASGRSPYSLTLDYFTQQELSSIPSHGPLPVSVPGTVDGWFEMHERFGSIPMSEILAPAVRYAREGFPVTEVIAYYWGRSVPTLSKYPGFTEQFTIDGRAPAKGEIWKNPNLANTLERIGAEGRDVFYKGDFARIMDQYMKENGGFLSERDLAEHTGEWVEPVSTNYRGWDVWELPPNGQGIAALQMLNILEGYDLRGHGFGSPEHVHLVVEAKKLAFEDRAKYYADPDFNDIPVDWLVSKEYAAQRRELINETRASAHYDPGTPTDGDTIYMTVADSEGNMVSLIQSNYRGMGSGMAPTGLGFIFQDRGELFNLEPGHFNSYAPHKRPFHTIIPAFVTKDGKPLMSFGVMGGAMQPQGHTQIIINMIDFDMNLQEAGDAPRIHHTGSSTTTGNSMQGTGTTELESGYSDETLAQLKAMGHNIKITKGPFGGYQAIFRDSVNGVYYGASESRKDGHAAGY